MVQIPPPHPAPRVPPRRVVGFPLLRSAVTLLIVAELLAGVIALALLGT